MDKVILVNEQDEMLGTMDKQEAHIKGLLHRAVSVIIINSKNEMLLQRRAATKYHSAGLWTNAACTHPAINESNIDAAKRRLKEEMGLEVDLEFAFHFIYKAALDNGLIEHEYDHVYIGVCDDLPKLNREEADDYKYIPLVHLQNDVALHPQHYTEWFKILLPKILNN